MSNQNNLKKRLRGDIIITYVFTGAVILAGILRLVGAISRIANRAGQNEAYFTELRSAMNSSVSLLFIGAALIFFCLVLAQIQKTGKPFSKASVKYLRIMSIILCLATVAPIFTDIAASFLDPFCAVEGDGFHFIIGSISIVTLIFSAVVAIVAEIANYGCGIQEDLDSIA